MLNHRTPIYMPYNSGPLVSSENFPGERKRYIMLCLLGISMNKRKHVGENLENKIIEFTLKCLLSYYRECFSQMI